MKTKHLSLIKEEKYRKHKNKESMKNSWKKVFSSSNGAGSWFVVETRSIDNTVLCVCILPCYIIVYLAMKAFVFLSSEYIIKSRMTH